MVFEISTNTDMSHMGVGRGKVFGIRFPIWHLKFPRETQAAKRKKMKKHKILKRREFQRMKRKMEKGYFFLCVS